MSASIMQKEDNEHGQALDVPRLIDAVRGSRAARVLFELRPWLQRPADQIEGGPAPNSNVVSCSSSISTEVT